MVKEQLRAKLAAAGQEHLLAFWDQLDDAERAGLAAQLESVDFEQVDALYRNRGSEVDFHELADRAEPPSAIRLDREENPFSGEEARARGAEALAAGKVGALLVAGGQGTRLGLDHPKGMFSIGPVSGASLFQILLEKIVATARRYGAAVPLYLMTSPATDRETKEYLQQHQRFGLGEDELTIFCQETMPAVDAASGKLLLEAPGRLFLSPDGHGGTVAALAHSGALEDARRRGLEQLFYFQVDNPLTPVCDPELIGYHLLARSELSTLAIAKTAPNDRVGNIVSVDGREQIIEYSDLEGHPAASRRNDDGSLTLWAGNTAVHVFDVAFLARMTEHEDSLPFHVARKAVPYLDASGHRVEPETKNALKFERFIFDLMPRAQNALVVEALASEAFAPVKNATGELTDTPQLAQAAIVALHRRWLEAAGARVAADVPVEISPLFALDEAQLGEKIKPGLEVTEARYFV